MKKIKLKAENSSLKAKKSCHKQIKNTSRRYRQSKHKASKSDDAVSNTDQSTKTTQNKCNLKGPKEERTIKTMRNYDTDWWMTCPQKNNSIGLIIPLMVVTRTLYIHSDFMSDM